MEWINFRHLYSFWSVCRYGGFQKAAVKNNVSQSAISDQVSQLEDYLEESLLERSTRSFTITPVGKKLLAHANEIFQESATINNLFRDKKISNHLDELRMGIVGGISRNFVYRLLKNSIGDLQSAKVSVIDGSFDELRAMLRAFEVELILSLEVPNKRDLLHLSYQKVESSPLCIAGRPEVIKRIKAKRAKRMPMNLFMFHHHFEEGVFDLRIAPRFSVDFQLKVTTDDISLLRFLANSGEGVAILPEIGIQEDLDARVLSRIRLDELPSVDFFGIFLKDGFHKEAISDFLDS